MRIMLAFAVLCFGLFPGGSEAADAVCADKFDDVVKGFADHKLPVEALPADKLQIAIDTAKEKGIDATGATRALLASNGAQILLGIEKDGCLLPPIILGPAPQPTADHLSGRTPDGLTHA